jgi:thioredoxin-dependent peroxiredoxin
MDDRRDMIAHRATDARGPYTRPAAGRAALAAVAIASLAVGAPLAWSALATGQQAPSFETQASLNGKEFKFSLQDALKKGNVVVYFYPSAYTMGCNIQAREFAQNIDKFKAAGASVVGVSLDSIERLNAFSADPEYCGGKLPVASDKDGSIARSYDLKIVERKGMKDSRGLDIEHGFTERTTFLVRPDGTIAATIGGMSPAENVNQALAAAEQFAPGAKPAPKAPTPL